MKKLLTAALLLTTAWAVYATLAWRTEAEEHAADRKAAEILLKRLSAHVRLDTARPPQPDGFVGK